MINHMCDEGVIETMLSPKLIPMAMVERGLSYGGRGTSNFQKKEYLTVSCIFQGKYSWPAIFICMTRLPRRGVTGSS